MKKEAIRAAISDFTNVPDLSPLVEQPHLPSVKDLDSSLNELYL